MDATRLLDDNLLRHVVELVGEFSYLSVAGTCRRFNKIYREVYGTCTTSAEEMVSTIAGAERFCSQTSVASRFRTGNEELRSSDAVLAFKRSSALEFVRDTAALNGRLDVLQWAVIDQGCPMNDWYTEAFAAYSENSEVMTWALENSLSRVAATDDVVEIRTKIRDMLSALIISALICACIGILMARERMGG